MPNFPDHSPFKILESYDALDSVHFFGREKEIIQLNELLGSSKFVLLYGASGTGKTSLIQCGLSGMFSPKDWYPFFIRRNEDFVNSIHAQLNQEFKNWYPQSDESKKSAFSKLSIRDKIKQIFQACYRPIYLILDQFEEIFTLSSNKQQETRIFFEELLDLNLFREDLFCKIIISCREEYIAHFYQYEKKVPFLFENRFRLEKMRDEQILECIKGLITTPYAGYPSMTYSSSVDHHILEKLKNNRGEIELTELQIYLDRLYRHDVERIQNQQLNRTHILFDLELIGEDAIGDVMNDFLDEQLNRIKLEKPKQELNTVGLPLKIMFKLLSNDGTKKHLSCQEIVQDLSLGKQHYSFDLIQDYINQLLSPEIKLLNRLNLTSATAERYEIMHDRMAECVYKRLSSEETRYREAVSILKSRFKRYEEEQLNNPKKEQKEYLSEGDLLLLSQVINAAQLEPYLQIFIQESKDFHAQQRRNKSIRRFTLIFLTIFIPVSILLTIWKIQKDNLDETSRLLRAELLKSNDPNLAKAIVDSAIALNPSSNFVIQVRKMLWANHQFYRWKEKFSGSINAITVSEDGQMIIATYDKALLKLDKNGHLIRHLNLDAAIQTMRLNRFNTGVYFVDDLQRLFEWQFDQSKPQLLGTLNAMLFGLDYFPAKDILAIMEGDGTLKLWKHKVLIDSVKVFEMDYAGFPKIYPDHTLAFSRDGEKLVSCTYENSAIIFDLKGKIFRKVSTNGDYILSVDYSPIKDEVLTCGRDGQVLIWNAEKKVDFPADVLPTNSISNTRDRINLGKFSHDGKMVMLGYTNSALKIWYLHRSVVVTYGGHVDIVTGGAWGKGSRSLIASSYDSSLITWNLASHATREFGPYPKGIEGLSYIPERNELIIASGTGEKEREMHRRNYQHSSSGSGDDQMYIHRWNLGQKPFGHIKKATELDGVRSLVALNGGKQIVFAGKESGLFFWDLQTDKFNIKESSNGSISDICQIYNNRIAVVRQGAIEIWSAEGQLLQPLNYPLPFMKVNCVAYNPHNKKIYCGIENLGASGLFEWNGKWKNVPGFPASVKVIAFSAHSKMVAVGSMENSIYLSTTDFKTPVQKMMFTNFSHDGTEECFDLAFSPDGKKLAAATKGSKVIIFDIKSRSETMLLSDVYEEGVFRVIFSPNGRSIYAGTGDGWVYQYKIP